MEVNGKIAATSVILYHYYRDSSPIISIDLCLNPLITTIPGLILKNEYLTYFEEPLDRNNSNQDIQLINDLLNQAIINYNPSHTKSTKRREVFQFDIKAGESTYKCLLINEYYIQPNFKQVQILPSNKILRYDNINVPIAEIKMNIVNLLLP